MLGALCLPLAMAPTPAFASASASRRTRRDEPEAVTEEEPVGFHDATWEALRGEKITTSRGELPPLTGKLVAFDESAIELEVPNGDLVSLARDEITGVRRDVPPPAPP